MNNVLRNNVLQIIYELINSVANYYFSEIGNFIRAQYRVQIVTLRSQD